MNIKSFVLMISLSSICICQTNAQITINGTITDNNLNPITAVLVENIDEADTNHRYSDYTDVSENFTISNITSVDDNDSATPGNYIILSNYPNPFNPSTVINFELPGDEDIEIKIFDIPGREVSSLYNDYHGAGAVIWDGRNNWNIPVSSGLYFCRLKTKDRFKVHKMVFLDGGQSAYTSGDLKYAAVKLKTKPDNHRSDNLRYTIYKSFYIDWDPVEIDIHKIMPVSLNEAKTTMFVYGYVSGSDDPDNYLSLGKGVVFSRHINTLIDENISHIVIIVMNNVTPSSPYTETSNITLDIKLKSSWLWGYVTIRARVGPVIYISSSGDQSIGQRYTFQISDHFVDISDDRTQLSSHWIDEKAWYKHEGELSIKVNNDTYAITDFDDWDSSKSISENMVTQYVRSDIRRGGKINIPMVYEDDDTLIHQIKGTDVCTVIDELKYVWTLYPDSEYELSYTLQSWACDEDADILFWQARQKDDRD